MVLAECPRRQGQNIARQAALMPGGAPLIPPLKSCGIVKRIPGLGSHFVRPNRLYNPAQPRVERAAEIMAEYSVGSAAG
jgi:hypothetical protein